VLAHYCTEYSLTRYLSHIADGILLAVTVLYGIVVLFPLYAGSIGNSSSYQFHVGIEPSWYPLYGDQNYHDGPTYILARSLHMAIPLIVAPLFIARALTLRQTWGQLGLRTKVTRVFMLSAAMVILVLYILSFWTASSWLLQ
jgi:hypothetical protein